MAFGLEKKKGKKRSYNFVYDELKNLVLSQFMFSASPTSLDNRHKIVQDFLVYFLKIEIKFIFSLFLYQMNSLFAQSGTLNSKNNIIWALN